MNLPTLPIWVKVAACAALAAILLISFNIWESKIESRGYDRAKSEYTQKALIATQAARARETELQTQLQVAQNEARKREADLAIAADSARAERDGLRDELASISDRLSRASADSLRKYAATASRILAECTNQLTEMARKADGHASDTLMLMQGWPKKN